MEILVDTNVFLDVVLNRAGCGAARDFFVKARRYGDRTFVSASALTDVFYIVRKHGGAEKAYEAVGAILGLASVMPVTERDIRDAYAARWRDFEDCVQYKAALNRRFDLCISNNTADFEERGLPVMTPDDYVNNTMP